MKKEMKDIYMNNYDFSEIFKAFLMISKRTSRVIAKYVIFIKNTD